MKGARFYVFRKTFIFVVLVAVSFVTGAEDALKLTNSTYHNLLADAIAQ
ncbi:MAG: hypothetical protein WBA93_09775 [Microcoleaceae cyanobacterium]